jgi:hypothetical protein
VKELRIDNPETRAHRLVMFQWRRRTTLQLGRRVGVRDGGIQI